jgi:hypothetical protein
MRSRAHVHTCSKITCQMNLDLAVWQVTIQYHMLFHATTMDQDNSILTQSVKVLTKKTVLW